MSNNSQPLKKQFVSLFFLFILLIPTITTFTSTLSLPTSTGTLALTSDIPSSASYVTVSGNQTITGTKTFNVNPEISAIVKSGNTVTFPLGTTTLVGKDTIDALLNKEIDSSTNLISITNSPLTSVDVNSLINQDIRTTSSPTFNNVSLTGTLTDDSIRNILGLNGSIVTIKTNVLDTFSNQIITGQKIFFQHLKYQQFLVEVKH